MKQGQDQECGEETNREQDSSELFPDILLMICFPDPVNGQNQKHCGGQEEDCTAAALKDAGQKEKLHGSGYDQSAHAAALFKNGDSFFNQAQEKKQSESIRILEETAQSSCSGESRAERRDPTQRPGDQYHHASGQRKIFQKVRLTGGFRDRRDLHQEQKKESRCQVPDKAERSGSTVRGPEN